VFEMYDIVMNDDTLLHVKNVSIVRDDRHLLENVDVCVNKGRIVTIIGPNGAGKTTLVRVMLGLEKLDGGKVYKKPGLSIGYMPQKLQVPEHMPIDVTAFIRLGKRVNADQLRQLSMETGVAHLLDQPMQSLSGGEHQRVLLCRALVRDPQLLVLDEPVQGVDVNGQSALYQLIGRIREKRGCSVVMVSHDLHLVMAATDEVLCLNRHVCCAGHPETVTKHNAYLDLFGPEVERSMALYTHHHNHRHTMHGDVVEDDHSHG
jgi:zinc transport system ATP-binding protein